MKTRILAAAVLIPALFLVVLVLPKELAAVIMGVLQAVAAMPEAVALNGRVLQYRARACVELGQLELAEELMENNVEAISTNVREGELSVTDLWITLQKKKAIARGEEPLEKYKVPQKWNFRMKNE